MTNATSAKQMSNPREKRIFEKLLKSGNAFRRPYEDACLFLKTAASFNDETELLYLLMNKNFHGIKQLRRSLSASSTLTFSNNFVMPFLAILATDTLNYGTCRQTLMELIKEIFKTPGFVAALAIQCDNIENITVLSWFCCKMVLGIAEARDDDEIHNLIQSLILKNAPGARKIEAMCKSSFGSGDVESEMGLDEILEVPGGRHDNDKIDFRKITILPTIDEIMCKQESFLPKSIEYKQNETMTEQQEASAQEYHIERQFRLLRNDMISSIRDTVQELLQKNQKKGRNERFVYEVTRVEGVSTSKQAAILVHFKLPPGHRCLRIKTLKNRVKFWEHYGKGTLPMDSLVGIMIDDELKAFARVSSREAKDLAEYPQIGIFILNNPEFAVEFLNECSQNAELNVSMITRNRKSISTLKIKLVQASSSLFSYRPILQSLKEMDEIPLADLILFNKKSEAPKYLQHIDIEKVLEQYQATYSYDQSQYDALRYALTSTVPLIQGPPGTGKTMIGVHIAEIIQTYTSEQVLCVCYTNHALDAFLEDLMKCGITEIVRLGSRSKSKKVKDINIKELVMKDQSNLSHSTRRRLHVLRTEMKITKSKIDEMNKNLVETSLGFKKWETVDPFLRNSYPNLVCQLDISDGSLFTDGMKIVAGKKGKALTGDYLWKKWLGGSKLDNIPKLLQKHVVDMQNRSLGEEGYVNLWDLPLDKRRSLVDDWRSEYFRSDREELVNLLEGYEKLQLEVLTLRNQSWTNILKNSRFIGCTTTGAAQHKDILQAVGCKILIIEEAAEILECHVLTSLTRSTKHLIQIGDHQQLRPKVDTYKLSVSAGEGYDLDCSLFERMVMAGAKHSTLKVQHRMHPDMSKLIRSTYPYLQDHPSCKTHPCLKGVQDRVIWISHEIEEDVSEAFQHEASSKTNKHEVMMVKAVVKYLNQQGYSASDMVVLTPYLGQLLEIEKTLCQEWDLFLDDADRTDLLKVTDKIFNSEDKLGQGSKTRETSIRIATIDNYQGEQSDIVIISLCRSNSHGNIGFLREPERVNVLLSRARNGMILIGNDKTFRNARTITGAELWNAILDTLSEQGNIYCGLPIVCQNHSLSPAQPLSCPEQFEVHAPLGGCTLLCKHELDCGHVCPLSCHNSSHSNVKCKEIVYWTCTKGHSCKRECSTVQGICDQCKKLEKMMREAKQAETQIVEKQNFEKQEMNLRQKEAEIEIRKLRASILQQEEVKHQKIRTIGKEIELDKWRKLEKIKEGDVPTEVAAAVLRARETSENELNRASKIAEQHKHQVAPNEKQTNNKEEDANVRSKSDKETLHCNQSSLPGIEKHDQEEDPSQIMERATALGKEMQIRIIQGSDWDKIKSCLISESESVVYKLLLNLGCPAAKQLSKAAVANDFPASEETKVFAETCVRPLKLLAEKNYFEAAKVFEAVARSTIISEQDRVASFILIGLCKYKMGCNYDEVNANCRPITSLHIELGNLFDAVRTKEKKVKVWKAISFLLSYHSSQIPSCAEIARKCLQEGSEALLSCSQSISDKERTVQDMVEKLEPKADIPSLKKLLNLTGLWTVKQKFFEIRDYIRIATERNDDVRSINYNAVFTGNPGVGKTTVARLYSQLLCETNVLPQVCIVETSGTKLLVGGIRLLQKYLHNNLSEGGVLFIDEAYQLNTPTKIGNIILDYLLTEIEDRRGTLTTVITGYEKQIEKLISLNEGLPSRFPYHLKFADFSDDELCSILIGLIENHSADLHLTDAKYARIASKRLGRLRREGFGNARDVRNFWEKTLVRQAARIIQEREETDLMSSSSIYEINREDLLGPKDVRLACSKSMKKLNELIGLEQVKQSVDQLINVIHTNVEREELEKPIQEISLNRCFLGSPGTGKTTVAKIYGEILRDIGLLSKGDVIVKNPSDFIGAYIGHSEQNTNAILKAAEGCVLVIDEAYGLFPSGNGARTDVFRVAVINTLVARIQGIPGEDLCVLLLGYPKEMEKMLREANPGLARRFQIENSFIFEDYDDTALMTILQHKANARGLQVPYQSARVAIEVLSKQRMSTNFGNAGSVENLLSKAVLRMEKRLRFKSAAERAEVEIQPIDFNPEIEQRPAEGVTVEYLNQIFEDLVGCDFILQHVQELFDSINLAKNLGRDPLLDVPMVYSFTGSPGTGKTTIARRLGTLFYRLGLLGSDEIHEVSASEFTPGYIGQSGGKTREIFSRARGKVLFIDEAYRLHPNRGGSFMTEVCDEIVNILTEENFKQKLLVVFAGYKKDIEELMQSNAGLKSRVNGNIHFPSFGMQDCITMLRMSLKKKGLELPSNIDQELGSLMMQYMNAPNWANGRDIETWSSSIFRTVAKHTRSLPLGANLRITQDQLEEALEPLLNNKNTTRTHFPMKFS